MGRNENPDGPGSLSEAAKELGVKSGASYEEIKAAWRRAAMARHPDRNPEQSGTSFARARAAWSMFEERFKPGEPCVWSEFEGRYGSGRQGPSGYGAKKDSEGRGREAEADEEEDASEKHGAKNRYGAGKGSGFEYLDRGNASTIGGAFFKSYFDWAAKAAAGGARERDVEEAADGLGRLFELYPWRVRDADALGVIFCKELWSRQDMGLHRFCVRVKAELEERGEEHAAACADPNASERKPAFTSWEDGFNLLSLIASKRAAEVRAKSPDKGAAILSMFDRERAVFKGEGEQSVERRQPPVFRLALESDWELLARMVESKTVDFGSEAYKKAGLDPWKEIARAKVDPEKMARMMSAGFESFKGRGELLEKGDVEWASAAVDAFCSLDERGASWALAELPKRLWPERAQAAEMGRAFRESVAERSGFAELAEEAAARFGGEAQRRARKAMKELFAGNAAGFEKEAREAQEAGLELKDLRWRGVGLVQAAAAEGAFGMPLCGRQAVAGLERLFGSKALEEEGKNCFGAGLAEFKALAERSEAAAREKAQAEKERSEGPRYGYGRG